MSPSSDPIQQRRDLLDQLTKDVLPVIKSIQKHTMLAKKALASQPVDTLTLSNEGTYLALDIERLGDRMADAGFLARDCKQFYEEAREEHKVRLVKEQGEAAGVADSMKVKLSRGEFDVFNESTLLLERIQFLVRSTGKTMDMIRTKISLEKSNERNA